MARIKKRQTKGGIRYLAEVRRQGHPAVSKTFTTKADASKWAREQEVVIERGGRVDVSGRTLADAIDRYIEEKNPETNRKTILSWWKDELGSTVLTRLRKADIVEARTRLQGETNKQGQPYAPATVNRRVAALSAVLTCCTEEWFYIETNPARVRTLPEDNERVRILTDQERDALLDACASSDQPALLAFVHCAMASGARAGELQDLRWTHLDLNKGVARLMQTKNGDRRVIPIQGKALQALKDYRDAFPTIGTGFVFRNNTGTYPFHYHKSWAAAKDAAGVTELRFHDLRHDAASNLAMAGASLAEIGQVLGHRSAQMSKRYSHFVDDHVTALGKRLSERIDK